jgi:hypothetical protein
MGSSIDRYASIWRSIPAYSRAARSRRVSCVRSTPRYRSTLDRKIKSACRMPSHNRRSRGASGGGVSVVVRVGIVSPCLQCMTRGAFRWRLEPERIDRHGPMMTGSAAHPGRYPARRRFGPRLRRKTRQPLERRRSHASRRPRPRSAQPRGVGCWSTPRRTAYRARLLPGHEGAAVPCLC